MTLSGDDTPPEPFGQESHLMGWVQQVERYAGVVDFYVYGGFEPVALNGDNIVPSILGS